MEKIEKRHPQQPAVLHLHTDKTSQTIAENAINSRIDLSTEYTAPQVCMELTSQGEKSAVMTLGNFSLITGKAKSGKTFWMTSVLAAAVNNNITVNNLTSSLPKGQQTCLFFDTEQSQGHVQKAARRVLKMADVTEGKHFVTHSLRPYNASERIKIIEHVIYNTPGLGFVVIDGVRDLITAINCEQNATLLTSKLLKWSEDLNIHISCVIHQNKGDTNARGHVGTELVNKAEIVIGLTKTTRKGLTLFTVEKEYSRDMGFPAFSFSRNDNEMLSIYVPGFTHITAPNPKFAITDYTKGQHLDVLALAFDGKDALKYSELQTAITGALLKQDIIISQVLFRNLREFYLQNNYLVQVGREGTKASVYMKTSQ